MPLAEIFIAVLSLAEMDAPNDFGKNNLINLAAREMVLDQRESQG
jgi:hypothetical protein